MGREGWTRCSRNTIKRNRVIDDAMSCVCRMLRGDEKLLKYPVGILQRGDTP